MSTTLPVSQPQQLPAPPNELMETTTHRNPIQAKADAIAELTMAVYKRASQLVLTQEEIQALRADLPDDAFRRGAGGKYHLIYIQHSFLRQRLNDVIGIGQWALVPRQRWTEDFKTSNGKDAVRVYVEAMLIVRGCFVGEAIGDMDYYPDNPSTNFGDAVEGAKSAALRRCVKELGVGLQIWNKTWCEEWLQKHQHETQPSPENEQLQKLREAMANAKQTNGTTLDATQSDQVIHHDGPCIQVQRDRIIEIAQQIEMQKSELVAILAKRGKAKLSDLTYQEAEGLIGALERKQTRDNIPF